MPRAGIRGGNIALRAKKESFLRKDNNGKFICEEIFRHSRHRRIVAFSC